MKTRVMTIAELEQHEKDAIKKLAQVQCSCIDDCDVCPFLSRKNEHMSMCIVRACREICDKNHIEYNEDYS